MPRTTPADPATHNRRVLGRLLLPGLLLATAMQSGCINIGVMMGKVFFGDPLMTSVFEQRTGVSLEKTQKKIAVVCTAPASISGSFDALQHDLQDEVARKLKVRQLNVARSDEVINALESAGGQFERDAFAFALPDVDYIVHVDIERCTHTEDSSPDMYRGRANGIIYVYEVDRAAERSASPRVLQVFYQEFNSEYPGAQPVMADQMSTRIFQKKFVDSMAESIARTFYDLRASESF